MTTLATAQALQDQATLDVQGMTWERWQTLSTAARDAITRRHNTFHPKLIGFEGSRVEVTYSEPVWPACDANAARAAMASDDGKVTVERFQVGRSTGWKPCHLALYSRRAHGGAPVASSAPIASVRRIGR